VEWLWNQLFERLKKKIQRILSEKKNGKELIIREKRLTGEKYASRWKENLTRLKSDQQILDGKCF